MSSLAFKANVGLDLTGKNTVISGGTQGIGSAIAVRFAQAGSNVWIVGRNEELGQKVVQELKAEAEKRHPGEASRAQFEFIKADLSLVSSVHSVAKTLSSKTNNHVDYLITTQGGPPNGLPPTFTPTTPPHETHFAIQLLSRFGLAYLLASSGTLKDTWLSICAPGGPKSAAPDLDDLELTKVNGEGTWRVPRLLRSAGRDTAVMDGITSHFSTVFPKLRAVHAFPGMVTTSAMANQSFPTPLIWASNLFAPILSSTIGNSPTSYSSIPLYLVANPESKGKNLEFTNERLKAVGRPQWTEGPEKRTELWKKLEEMIVKEGK